MTERLATLRAALWRAVALTLAEDMPTHERLRIIATAKHVDESLTLSAQLFEEPEQWTHNKPTPR